MNKKLDIKVLLETGKREPIGRDSKICYRAEALQALFSDITAKFAEIVEYPERCPFAYVSSDLKRVGDFVSTKWKSWIQVWDGIIFPLKRNGEEVGVIKELYFKESEIESSKLIATIKWHDEPFNLVMIAEAADTETQFDTIFANSARLKEFELTPKRPEVK